MSLVPHTDEGKAQDITDVSCLLWAIGRDANTVDLGIETTGVELNRGFIKVDEYQNTTVKNLYALGDIAGKKLLTPGETIVMIIVAQLYCFVCFFFVFVL